MTLRQTIIFIPKGETETVKVEIYTDESVPLPGYWEIEVNRVFLSPALYNQFRSCRTQAEQRKFFDQLIKVSNFLLP